MSKKPKEIKLAIKYLGRGEYSRVIRLLEPKIPLFLENKEFYTVLAKAFFYTGDNAGSKLYFDRGQKILWDIESALYLGVLGLKRRDFNSSIRIWLDILDEDPDNKVAVKGLAILKKYSTLEELESFIHSKKIDKLIPRKPIRLATSTIISIVVVFALIGGTILLIKSDFVNRLVSNYGKPYIEDNTREGGDSFSLDNLEKDYIDFKEVSKYSFTGAQIEDFFKTAHILFLESKDNMVRTYLNLIKYSNANEQVKSKANRLESYLIDPNWANYNDNITFSDVDNNLYQYENCLVRWKGSISNLVITNVISFDLLVGYDERKVLEGVIPVELNQNIMIDDSQPIEVFGKIKLIDNEFYIEALTVMHYINRN